MKVSVSLPEADVEFLDAYAQSQGVESRSAVVHRAVGLLRVSELGNAYEDAFRAWDDDAATDVWEAVVADGLDT
jgi:Arc/MetJ-type ribon-helix-helix transcriptional regulator